MTPEQKAALDKIRDGLMSRPFDSPISSQDVLTRVERWAFKMGWDAAIAHLGPVIEALVDCATPPDRTHLVYPKCFCPACKARETLAKVFGDKP